MTRRRRGRIGAVIETCSRNARRSLSGFGWGGSRKNSVLSLGQSALRTVQSVGRNCKKSKKLVHYSQATKADESIFLVLQARPYKFVLVRGGPATLINVSVRGEKKLMLWREEKKKSLRDLKG